MIIGNRNRGSALVIVLWLIAILAALVSSFSLTSLSQLKVSDSISQYGQSGELARTGLEAWLGQLRAASLADASEEVIATEVMHSYPRVSPVSITEIDPGNRCSSAGTVEDRVAIFNRSQQPVNITGWHVVDSNASSRTASVPSSFLNPTILAPGQTYVFTTWAEGSGLTNSGDAAILQNQNQQEMDRVSWTGGAPGSGSNQTWKVYPDGWNGYKPAETREADNDLAWRHTDCNDVDPAVRNFGDPDGAGFWAAVGDGSREALELIQSDADGNIVNTFDFDISSPSDINFNDHFVAMDRSDSLGYLTIANNFTDTSLETIYPNGSSDTFNKVINTGGAFPQFSDTTIHVSARVPQPEFGNVTWSEWAYSDTIVSPGVDWGLVDPVDAWHPSSATPDTRFIVRTEMSIGPGAIRRSDTEHAIGHPGDSMPAAYTGNAADFQFGDPTNRDGKLYVSELYDTAMVGSEALVITRMSNDHSTEFIEIYNPSNISVTLESIQEENDGSATTINQPVGPGSYFLICDGAAQLSLGGTNYNCDEPNGDLSLSNGGEGLQMTYQTSSGNKTDKVGHDGAPVGFREGPGVNVSNDMNVQRKTTAGGKPQDTNDNSSDFDELVNAGDLEPLKTGFLQFSSGERAYVELTLFGDPLLGFGQDHEFVEVFNQGGADEDLAGGAWGLEKGGTSFSLQVHPADPNQADGTLQADSVGIVAPDGIDTGFLGIADSLNQGEIRLYRSDFFDPQGFSDTDLNHFVFTRPAGSGGDQEILAGSPDWGDHPANYTDYVNTVIMGQSLAKSSLSDPDDPAGWPRSQGMYGGDPGEVPGEVDSYHRAWGWEGTIFNGIAMGDTVYVPSLQSSVQNGDIGLFRIRKIEDESGKQDLVRPRNLACQELIGAASCTLGEHTSDGRTMRLFSFAQDIIDRDTDAWFKTADLLAINNLSQNRFEARRSSYSALRPNAATDTKTTVNINTASWEALRGIQMSGPPVGSGDVHMVTDEMAKAIIDERGSDVSSELPITSGDDYPELSPEAYPGGTPFESSSEACDLIGGLDPNFQCNVFSEYTTVTSEGRFWVEVEGVSLNSNGEPRGSAQLEALVDRNPLINADQPIKILHLRVR